MSEEDVMRSLFPSDILPQVSNELGFTTDDLSKIIDDVLETTVSTSKQDDLVDLMFGKLPSRENDLYHRYVKGNDPGGNIDDLTDVPLIFFGDIKKKRRVDFAAEPPKKPRVDDAENMFASADLFAIVSEYCDKGTSDDRKYEIIGMLQSAKSPLWRNHERERQLFVKHGTEVLCEISKGVDPSRWNSSLKVSTANVYGLDKKRVYRALGENGYKRYLADKKKDLEHRHALDVLTGPFAQFRREQYEKNAMSAWYDKFYRLKKGNIDDVREIIVALREEDKYNVLNVPDGEPDLDALGMLLCSYVGYSKAASPETLSVDDFGVVNLRRIYHHMGFGLPLNLAKFGQTDIRDLRGYGGATTLGDLYISANLDVIERANAFIALVYKSGVKFVAEPLLSDCDGITESEKEVFKQFGLVYVRQLTWPLRRNVYDALEENVRNKIIKPGIRQSINQKFLAENKDVDPERINRVIEYMAERMAKYVISQHVEDMRSGMCGKST